MGTGIAGTVAPQTANNLNQNLGYTYDPDTKAAIAGQVVGNTLPLVPAVFSGAGAALASNVTSGLLGASQFGNVRSEIAQRRLQGEQIGTGQELLAAGLSAAAEFVGERVGLGAITNESVRLAKNAVFNSLLGYARAYGVNASEEMFTQIVQNIVDRYVAGNANTNVESGVGQAGLIGGLVGVAGRGLHSVAGGAAAPVVAPQQATSPQPYSFARPVSAQPAEATVNNTGIPVEQTGNLNTIPLAGERVADPNAVPLAPAAGPAVGQETLAPSSGPHLPPLLQEVTPKHRISEGAGSRAMPLEFDSAIDKALYIAGQPRKGKLQAQAMRFLGEQNVSVGEILRVQEAVEQLAISQPKDAAVLKVSQVYNPQVVPFANPTTAERAATQVPLTTNNIPQSTQPPIRVNSPGFSSVQESNTNVEARPSKIKPINLADETAKATAAAGVAGSPNPQTVASPQPPLAQAPARDAGSTADRGAEGREQVKFLPDDDSIAAAVHDASKSTKGFRQAPPKNREQADAAKAFGQRGVKVVYYTGEGRGFRMKRHPGVVFINTKNVAEGLREAVSHEFMHELHDSRPGLFQEFRDAVPAAHRQEFEAWYAEAFGQQRPGEKPAAPEEEGVTTPFGRTAMLDRVWVAALGQQPTLVQKIMDFFREFTAKFNTKSKLMQQAIKTFEATLSAPVSPRRSVVADRADFLPEPNQHVRDEAEEYTKSAGIPFSPDNSYVEVNEERAKEIAAWYESAKHDPTDPAVKASYDAMKAETLAQWKFLESNGVRFERWTKDGQPYSNSQEMMKDVTNNRHLYFFTGGEMPSDHPLADKAPVDGDLTYNDVFRAVHDYFGHTKEGLGFGPRGEENAWRAHSQMFTPTARRAMSAETRGQNSWVNYGPFGEHNRSNAANTQYAEQKAVVMPQRWVMMTRPAQSQAIKEAAQAHTETLRQQTGTDKLEGLRDEFKNLSAKQDKQLADITYLPEKEEGERRKKGKEKAIAKLAPATRKLWDMLSPKEQTWVTGPGIKRVAEAYRTVRKSMSSEQWQASIRAGMPMRKWYQKATAAIRTIFQDDAPTFTALLAADSPRQKVDKNLEESLRIWHAWDDAGRPTDEATLKSLAEKHTRLATRIPNIARALSGKPLNGPKVNSFGENLLGNLNFVTNDTWMAQFSGLNEDFFKGEAEYLGYSLVVREEAEKAGIQPAEAQAAVWSFFSVLANSVNSTTLGRDSLARLNGEKVANANQFDLISDESVRQGLIEAGYSEDAIRSAAEAAEAIVATENAGTKLTAADKRLLLPLAERAERVAKFKTNYEKVAAQDEAADGGTYDEVQLPEVEQPADDIAFLPAALRTRGELPEEVAQANAERIGNIASEQKQAKFATADLGRAIRKDYGVSARKLPAADVEQINEALKGKVPLTSFKPATAAAIQAMRDHVDSMTIKLAGTSLVDPRLKTLLGANLGTYLNRSYRVFDDPKWASKVPEPVMANAIKFIEGQLAAQGKSPSLAPVFVDELLQDWKEGGVGSLFGSGRLGAKNLSILKARKDIAPEIRALMGEYNNPFVNYVKSVSKMATLLSNHGFLETVKSEGMGKWLFEDDSAKLGYTTRIAAPESSTMAPLNGLRTSPEIAEAFQKAYDSKQLPAWARILMTANFVAKSSKTVFSLMTQMRNLIGQPYFNLLNGHFRINKYGKSFKTLAADLRSKGDAGLRDYVKEMTRLGILGQSVQASEILNDLKDMGLQDVDMYSDGGFIPTVKRGLKATLTVPQTMYQVSDHLGKVYGFENELARSLEANPSFTDEEHKQFAADRVVNTYPTYSKIPPAVQALRRQPFVGPFVAFWYESMRTAGNSVIYAYTDLVKGKNAAQRRAGAERLAGLSMVAAGSIAAQAISRALLGIDDDDEEGFRKFLPDWSKGSTLLYLSKDDKGNWTYVDTSVLNPYSPIIDSLNSLIEGDESPMDRMANAAAEFFKPLTSEAIFTKALREVASNKKDTGSRVYNPEDSQTHQWTDVLGHLFKSIEPATLTRLRTRIIPGLQGQNTTYGEDLSPGRDISAELTGIKTRTFNFETGLSFQARSFKASSADISSLLIRELNRPGEIDSGDVLDAYRDMEKRRFNQWYDLHQKAMAAHNAGVSMFNVYRSLLIGGVGPDTAKAIISGRYEPYDLRSAAIKDALKRHRGNIPLQGMAAIYRNQVGKQLTEQE
jgi:hypothetical protein